MEIGIVGLGKMGLGMARRLLRAGHHVAAFDRTKAKVDELAGEGAIPAYTLESLADSLSSPRTIWCMVPAGGPVDEVISALQPVLSTDDIVVDGGNSYYRDSLRRASDLEARGIHFVDVGVSGGVWGESEGYCLMAGGKREAYSRLEPLLRSLAPAPDQGLAHVGPSGAGHFVKMVHNAIEYGMMEAYAEGFELMSEKTEFGLDLGQIAGLWQQGGVIRSWLLELAHTALEDDPNLSQLQSYVDDSGEGRWSVQESIEMGVPMPVVALALQTRFRSRQDQPFAGRMLAAMRQKFGGHAVRQTQ